MISSLVSPFLTISISSSVKMPAFSNELTNVLVISSRLSSGCKSKI
jgi:hypothetical protein